MAISRRTCDRADETAGVVRLVAETAFGDADAGRVSVTARADGIAGIWWRALMARFEATRQLVATLANEIVIASLGHPAYDLFAAGDRPANFYTWGSMGSPRLSDSAWRWRAGSCG